MAGQWKMPPSSRASMITYTCQTCTWPDQNRKASHSEIRAIRPSATIMTVRRFQRST